MIMFKKKSHDLMRRQARYGYVFLLPLLVGLVWFFVIPIVKSLVFSFCEVAMGETGYTLTWQGIKSYHYALRQNADYNQNVVSSVLSMLGQAPLIIVFSFFMASILNQNFKGRTAFRVIMFLPVVIVSANIMMLDSQDVLQNSMTGMSSYKSSFGGSMTSFSDTFAQYLQSVGLSQDVTDTVQTVVDGVYDIIGLSAIQILVLLTGMQSISPSLYEAAKVEGGTAWENFWKITFPMVSPLILTCVVYTIIDSFTSNDNTVMTMIESQAFTEGNFSTSAAMAWIYFAIVIVILAVVSFLISKFVFYYDD